MRSCACVCVCRKVRVLPYDVGTRVTLPLSRSLSLPPFLIPSLLPFLHPSLPLALSNSLCHTHAFVHMSKNFCPPARDRGRETGREQCCMHAYERMHTTRTDTPVVRSGRHSELQRRVALHHPRVQVHHHQVLPNERDGDGAGLAHVGMFSS